jgi:uncharacterized repeat protein (TIGR02543 family)
VSEKVRLLLTKGRFPAWVVLILGVSLSAVVSCSQPSGYEAESLLLEEAVLPAVLSISGVVRGNSYIVEVFNYAEEGITDAASFAEVTKKSNLVACGEIVANGADIEVPLLTASGSEFNGSGTFIVLVAEGNGGLRNIKMKHTSASFKDGNANIEWVVMISAPDYGINLDVPASYPFPPLRAGGLSQLVPTLTVEVGNAGNRDTGRLKVVLDGTNADCFILSVTEIGNIASRGASNGSASFTVKPKASLAEGSYYATVTVRGENGIFASFAVSQLVTMLPFYTVSFAMRGGVDLPAQYVIEGARVELPDTPRRAGYKFDGWYIDAEGLVPWNFERETVTENMMLFAKWVPVKVLVSVTFVIPGVEVPTRQIEVGQTVARPDTPVRDGWTFVNWYADSALTDVYNFGSSVTGNKTIYAKWRKKEYTVSFVAGDGFSITYQTVPHGGKVALDATFPTSSTDAYNFHNWYTEPEYVNLWDFEADVVTGDTTLHAKFEENLFVVRFDSAGADTEPSSQFVAPGGKAVKPADPAMEYRIFECWYTALADGQNRIWDFNEPVTGNTVLHAKWINETYTVTFDTRNGTTVGVQYVERGGRVYSPTRPAKDGLTFDGWFTEADSREEFNFSAPIMGNTIVYAQYYATVTLIYDGKRADKYLLEGAALENINLTVAYNTIDGWYTDSNGNGTKWNLYSPVTRNMTLHANLIPINYTVNLDYNGGHIGSRTSDLVTINWNNLLTVFNRIIFGNEGAEFPVHDAHKAIVNWFWDAEGEEQVIFDESFFEEAFSGEAVSVTIYIKWIQQYRIKFTYDGDTPDSFTADGGEYSLPSGTVINPAEDWTIWVTPNELIPLPIKVLEYFRVEKNKKLKGFYENNSTYRWRFKTYTAWCDMELTAQTDGGHFIDTNWENFY